MLSETFVASSLSPPRLTATNSTLLKDAGIFVHSFRPHAGLRSTFKKTATSPNCLAVSDSHIFAAQSSKAIVQVYNREKSNQEAIASFPERITSIVLAENDTVLAIGTEGGRILLWELCTGRQIGTSAAHLQPVSTLAVDHRGSFLLSGSSDAIVHVWSLLEILSFNGPNSSSRSESRIPHLTFSEHRNAITAIASGHSGSFADFAISASQDNTIHIWNHHTGEHLRTFLLPDSPLSLAIDPADRALYAGYKDGSIQFLNLYPSDSNTISVATHDTTIASILIQPDSSSRWTSHLPEPSPATCLAISYDGTLLLSGHSNGRIIEWDIAMGRFNSIFSDLGGADITSLVFLPPDSIRKHIQLGSADGNASLEAIPRIKVPTVNKPRPYDTTMSNGSLPDRYTITAQFTMPLSQTSNSILDEYSSRPLSSMEPVLPDFLIIDGLLELATTQRNNLSGSNSNGLGVSRGNSMGTESDFMQLVGTPMDTQNSELQDLRYQVSRLKKVQETSFEQISDLNKQRMALQVEVDHLRRKKLEKANRKQLRAEEEWATLGLGRRTAEGNAEIGSVSLSISSQENSSGEE